MKILKDFIIKTKNMQGYNPDYKALQDSKLVMIRKTTTWEVLDEK